MKEKSEVLLSCPHGHKAKVDGAYSNWVSCTFCGWSGPVRKTREQAIAAWNARGGKHE